MLKFKKSQSGRSMVEMLGVLAIIGVLSIGGIAGYRTAMKQKNYNDFAESIMLLKADLLTTLDNLPDDKALNIKKKYGDYTFQLYLGPCNGPGYCGSIEGEKIITGTLKAPSDIDDEICERAVEDHIIYLYPDDSEISYDSYPACSRDLLLVTGWAEDLMKAW